MTLSKLQIASFSFLWLIIDLLTKYFFDHDLVNIVQYISIKPNLQYPNIDILPQISSYSLLITILSYFFSIIMMVFFYTKYYHRIILFSLTLIITGIVGNLIDLLLFKAVKVFIQIENPLLSIFFNNSQLPLFNFSHLFIIVGAIIFIFNKKW